jgi:hypothetical protein
MEILVSNDAELKAAWPKVIDGGTILLANGVKFAGPQLQQKMTNLVTVRPVDPEGVPPEMTHFIFRGTTNLTIQGIKFVCLSRYTALEFRDGCSNITVEDCDIDCGHDIEVTFSKTGLRSGARFSGTNNAIRRCTFTKCGTGIGAGGLIGGEISGCKIKGTLLDCINVGSNTQNLVISDNELWGQSGRVSAEHHYDLLQFWVQTDAVMDTKNIKVLRNKFIAPDDAVTPQSIFGRADYGTNPYKFQDIEIAYNMIYSRQANAIRMTEGDNIDVHHNVLTFAGVDPWGSKTVFLPGILLQMATNSKIHHNIFPSKYGYPAVDTPEFYKNVVYKYPV